MRKVHMMCQLVAAAVEVDRVAHLRMMDGSGHKLYADIALHSLIL